MHASETSPPSRPWTAPSPPKFLSFCPLICSIIIIIIITSVYVSVLRPLNRRPIPLGKFQVYNTILPTIGLYWAGNRYSSCIPRTSCIPFNLHLPCFLLPMIPGDSLFYLCSMKASSIWVLVSSSGVLTSRLVFHFFHPWQTLFQAQRECALPLLYCHM